MDNPQFDSGEKFAPYPIKAKIDNPVSKQIKQEIDSKVKNTGSSESMFQRYERMPKRNGFVNARQFLL